MINAFLLENIMDSVTFLLLLFLGLLIMAVLALTSRINRNEKLNRETLSKLDVFERVITNASIPALIIDERGKVYFCNNEAAKLLGRPREEIENDILDAYTIVTSSRNETSKLRKAIRENRRHTFEAEAGPRNDRHKYIFEIAEIHGGQNSRYLVGIKPSIDRGHDIYEHNLLETRMNEVEKAGGLGFWTYTYGDKTTTWSRGMYELLGKEINTSTPDLSFLAQLAPESRNEGQALLMAMKNKAPYHERVVIIGDDGKKRVVEITLRHQDDLNLNLYKTLGVMREVTDEQELIDEINSSQEFWKSLGQRDDVAIVVTDRNSRIAFANQYAAKVANKTNEELLGKEVSDYFGFKEIPPTELVTNSQPTFITSIRNPEGKGENVFLWSNSPVIQEDKLYLNVNIGVDLTKCASNLELVQAQYNSI